MDALHVSVRCDILMRLLNSDERRRCGGRPPTGEPHPGELLAIEHLISRGDVNATSSRPQAGALCYAGFCISKLPTLMIY